MLHSHVSPRSASVDTNCAPRHARARIPVLRTGGESANPDGQRLGTRVQDAAGGRLGGLPDLSRGLDLDQSAGLDVVYVTVDWYVARYEPVTPNALDVFDDT
jgi:hypothetical protein